MEVYRQNRGGKLRRLLGCLSAVLLGLASFGAPGASAAQTGVPYQSYTYWVGTSGKTSRKAVYTKPMYEIKTVLSARSLGVADFKQLTDLCTDGKGNTYLLDGQNSRLVILNPDYTLNKELDRLEMDGQNVDFTGAQSVYVHTDGHIYICDTQHARVLVADKDGKVSGAYTLPHSSLIPSGFRFLPIRVAVDSFGYAYVLSDGSYYGALLYSPAGEFIGFYGANRVKAGATQTFTNILSRIFVNNVKKAATASKLPYCFVDIFIDQKDFVYTATGYTTDAQKSGQIKKLNPAGGYNVLNSDSVHFGDEGENWTYTIGKTLESNIAGVSVDGDGYIYALDSTFGRVFLYDRECTMLSAFGAGMGAGEQAGSFKMPTSIALSGTDVLVGDELKNTVTVFGLTAFGGQVKQARTLTLRGEYLKSKPIWQSVLSQDRNCQTAYNGLARAYLAEGKFSQAMTLSKEGYDRDTYALAFDMMRQDFLKRYFLYVFAAAVLLLGGLMALLVITMRKKLVLVPNRQVRLMLAASVHPVDTFTEIKEKRQGSWKLCVLLAALFYVFSVLQTLGGGFPFTYYDPANFNSFWVLLRTVGLLALWVAVNWAVCTLMGGKGRLKEIAVVTCYSLTPLIVGQMLYLILTHLLLPSEAAFLGILQAVMLLYTLVLLTVGMITIHDFTMSRFIGTSVLTLLGIGIVVFLLIVIGILLQQFFDFLVTLGMELIS